MAGKGKSGSESGVTLWTFVIRGGEPFTLAVDRLGPPLNHDGSMTLWKMMGTEVEAGSIQQWITSPLIGARVVRHTEVETPEMVQIRHERLGRCAVEEEA